MSITWKSPTGVTERGYVGELHLFTVDRASRRHPEGIYILDAKLPGKFGDTDGCHWATPKDAQAAAEILLQYFAAYLTQHVGGASA